MSGHAAIISFLLSRSKSHKLPTSARSPDSSELPEPPTTLQQLAKSLGYKSHSSLTGAECRLPLDRQTKLAKIFGLSDDKACRSALKNENFESFKDAFDVSRQMTHPEALGEAKERKIGMLLEEDKENREQPPYSLDSSFKCNG